MNSFAYSMQFICCFHFIMLECSNFQSHSETPGERGEKETAITSRWSGQGGHSRFNPRPHMLISHPHYCRGLSRLEDCAHWSPLSLPADATAALPFLSISSCLLLIRPDTCMIWLKLWLVSASRHNFSHRQLTFSGDLLYIMLRQH